MIFIESELMLHNAEMSARTHGNTYVQLWRVYFAASATILIMRNLSGSGSATLYSL